MPSSPDATPAAPSVSAWEPGELRPGRRPASPAAAPAARPADAPPLFEVASAAAVPDDLLAEARASARAAGYSAGWTSGMRAAAARAATHAEAQRRQSEQLLAEQRAEFDRAIAGLDAAAAALERRSVPTVEQIEGLVLESAFAIAEALVGAALRDDRTRAPAALSRVLALAPVGEPVIVRLNPADHALLVERGDAAEIADRSISLEADPSLDPGDAIATSGATEIDARIRAGLARVRGVLGP